MLSNIPDVVPTPQVHVTGPARSASKANPQKVLIVDDESLIRFSLKHFVESEGCIALTADTGVHALKHFEEFRPDVVILDIVLPDTNGLVLLKSIKEIAPETTVIMITACADVRNTVEAMKLGAADYMEKPIDFDKLTKLLRTIQGKNLPNEKMMSEDGAVFTSNAMKEIIRIVELLATKSDVTALFLGESGTGKSFFCKIMHELSSRKEMPFVEIGCSTIPEHLFESELFGHEKGSFTDAKAMKRGLVEMANGGTVFLDEIGEMPYPLQSKILSLIEEKRFRRVGGLKYINADVRICAATNRNLHDLVQSKKFRLDLYYRLNVATIEMPPLRTRKEDIPELIQYYLGQFSDKYGGETRNITERVQKTLQEYHWPGNIRELKNLIEKLVILTRNAVIDIGELPPELFGQGRQTVPPVIPSGPSTAAVAGWNRSCSGLSLKVLEEECIRAALRIADGNQRKAAKLLDISRDTLRYRLKKLGIESSRFSHDGGDAAEGNLA